jgi:hypothetical protein
MNCLDVFTGGGGVWERAACNGRFTGIFNQPMEAGLAYLVAFILVMRMSARLSRFTLVLFLYMICIGGGLTISKVFLFGAPVVFVVSLFVYRKQAKTLLLAVAVPFVLALAILLLRDRTLPGVKYFGRFFDSQSYGGEGGGILNLLTSGRIRFEHGAFVVNDPNLWIPAWRDHRWLGFGFMSTNSPMDTMFVFAFYQGGLVASALLFASMAWLGVGGLVKAFRRSDWVPLLLAFALLFSCFGSPAYYLNRVSPLFWGVYVLTVTLACRKIVAKDGSGNAAAKVRRDP